MKVSRLDFPTQGENHRETHATAARCRRTLPEYNGRPNRSPCRWRSPGGRLFGKFIKLQAVVVIDRKLQKTNRRNHDFAGGQRLRYSAQLGHVAASLILLALLVACALRASSLACSLYAETGTAQRVPGFFLLRAF